MAASCCSTSTQRIVDPAFRRALWIALAVNAAMCLIEIAAGWQASSVALLADAIDFLGDSANYALSLAVIGMASRVRSRAALVKAGCMAAFGVFVLARGWWAALHGPTPEAVTMGVVGVLALGANAGVALTLYRFRSGDSNMQSAWVCSRNDAIGNLAVMAAALGVFGAGTAWPDLVVAGIMGVLAIAGAVGVFRLARSELAMPQAPVVEVRDCCGTEPESPPVRVAMPVSRKRSQQVAGATE
jgi:Co/Zn/Cd efflux system component